MSVSPQSTIVRATVADLQKTDGKAELVGGRIIRYMATGFRPSRIAFLIAQSLELYTKTVGQGFAFADNAGFVVPELSSGRESFSPDASYYLGPPPPDEMDFVEGPPTFAVEVRSKNDYGAAAERTIAEKRADYFEAGTLVVWDVDPLAKELRVYEASSRDQPRTLRTGQIADAEPALPGWRIAVDDIFA